MKTTLQILALILAFVFNSQDLKAKQDLTRGSYSNMAELSLQVVPTGLISNSELTKDLPAKCTASAYVTVTMYGISQTIMISVTDRCNRVKKTLQAAVDKLLDNLEQ